MSNSRHGVRANMAGCLPILGLGVKRAYRARLLVCCVEVNILFPKNTNSLKM